MSAAPLPPDLAALLDQLDAAERDARAVVGGLTEADGGWRPAPGSWSVAECLDHLATANRVYLAPMTTAAEAARARGRRRRGPAAPGFIGRRFVRSLEPPVKKSRFAVKAPRHIRPRTAPPLADALDAFLASQDQARAFLRAVADLDLNGVRFANPFIAGVRFSLATGLHVLVAHERRHLWQAWRVRQAREAASTDPQADR